MCIRDRLYSVGICAADYFLGAHSLFQPGSALISLYGSTYVPGNDTVATQMMLQDMAYAYCCAAQDKLTQATSIMQKIIKMIDGSAKGATKTLPKEFTTMYAQVKKAIIQAQALLVAQNTSAQAYFVQAGLASLAQAAQAMYIKVYQTSITFMKQCLVGDPVAAEYNNLLLDINTAYLQWASELNVESDAVQIAQINQEIVSLFVVAGEQCLKTSHEQAMYPGFKQVHYDSAAQNFLAAQKEYKSMSDTKMVKAMEDKIKLAYLSGCDQNMELYFYVKNHGVSYKSSSTGQMTVVSFDQMCQDYTSFEQTGTSIDPEEMHAYNSVQNLLLVATMLYQYLTGLFSVPAVAVVPTVSVSTTKKQTSNQKIVHYLRAHKALTQTDVVIPFGRAGVKEKILQVASPGYVHFLSDKSAVVAWLNMLIQVVQNVYMEDYLGATTSEASTQITKQTKEFFDAVQKEASSMQNPSSAYVG